MRIRRTETSVYHVITRIVAGEMLLDARAKEVLRKMLWQVADFSGVEVLAYCIMTNHLHILVRVPEMEGGRLPVAELLRRYTVLYGEGGNGIFPDAQNMAVILADERSEEAARWEGRLLARMNDVSAFMKTLKQRFSWWFNKEHGRFGTLWAERFKSVLVEDDPRVLTVVAAYIDLNPVRAGLVEDPCEYRWSSYGEAMGGEGAAQRGLTSAAGGSDWLSAVADYRMVLFGKGAQGRVGEQRAITEERVRAVLSAGGKVPLEDLLRCRIRYLSGGAVFGTESFVRGAGAAFEPSVLGGKKSLGYLPATSGGLCAWRKLQIDPIG